MITLELRKSFPGGASSVLENWEGEKDLVYPAYRVMERSARQLSVLTGEGYFVEARSDHRCGCGSLSALQAEWEPSAPPGICGYCGGSPVPRA